MTLREPILVQPWRHDFFALLRRLERDAAGKPRIGDSSDGREDVVRLGQDPFLAFPPSTLARATRDADGSLGVYVQFLGLLGPQGAMPLTLTEEAYQWHLAGDTAFLRFLDILNRRFLELFFRAWADARPIAQHDRPREDRFHAYIGSLVGIGTPAGMSLDGIEDIAKLPFAGLLAPRVKSASRLRSFLSGLFGVAVEVVEFLPLALPLDPSDLTRLGSRNSALGADLIVGRTVLSFEDRFRVRIVAATLAEYEAFLPGGPSAARLADAVRFAVGDEFEWDLELALPVREAPAARLGHSGRLGWTGWMTPERGDPSITLRRDARLRPQRRPAQAA